MGIGRAIFWICNEIVISIRLNLLYYFCSHNHSFQVGLLLLSCYKKSNIKLSAITSNFSAWNFALKRSCVVQSKGFYRSVKTAPNVPPLSRIFLNLSFIAIRACWVLYCLRKPHWNIDKAFLPFGLFDYKWDFQFLKARVIILMALGRGNK